MHAIRQYVFGPPENLQYEEVADPHPAAGQVRIAARACGVHLVDTILRAGQGGGHFQLPDLPMTPGREVAGIIDEVGDGVDERWLGLRVVAHLGPASGGYAEFAVTSVEAVHALADSVSDAAAVAMVGTGRMTMGILEVAQLRPDDVVLVTAAAGGIGTLLVQAAHHLGATVVGVAGGAAKVDRVRSSGADVAVDYTAPDWVEAVRKGLGGHDITVALDGVGGAVGRAAFDLLGPGGHLVTFGWSSGQPTEFSSADLFQRGLAVTVAVGPRILRLPGGLRALEELALAEAAAGTLVPAVTTFPLSDAPAAHTALTERNTIGKVVLLP